MAQSIPPVRQQSFGGVFTGGSVFSRPPDTAVRCHNLRPMPGGSLRLRGGWQRRLAGVGGNPFQQFHEFRKGTFAGGIYHIAQVSGFVPDFPSQTLENWVAIDLQSWSTSLIQGVLPGSQGRPLAITTVRDRVFFDNGLGVRGAFQLSLPPLSSWDGNTLRCVGLDCFPYSGRRPTAVLSGTPGFNNVQYGMSIYVGLHNSATNHFSNGILCEHLGGTDDSRLPAGSARTIEVRDLERIVHGIMSPPELGEQFYVFYATADGFRTPYLVLNTEGTDVFKVPTGVGGKPISASLSLTPDDPKGFIFSLAHEMPTENFPPRPMADMCYQNARVYYILRSGGLGPPSEFGSFSYVVPDSDASSVGWSAAADDYAEAEFVGAPEESFPLTNKKYVPSGERPLKISDLSNRGQVLVLTGTRSYWLEETADRLHVFQRISENRGILDKRTYRKTPRGPMWVTQNLEIVLLHEDSMSLEVLSENYAELLAPANYTGAFGVASDYLIDPPNQIDRYQVWAADGYFVIHDFWLERSQQSRNVTPAAGYSGKAFAVTAAHSMRDSSGRQYHLTAREAVWTQEGQPDTGSVRTTDQNEAGTVVELAGDYIGQWLDFGDPLLRKEIAEMTITGDGGYSGQLADRPVSLLWYSDLYNALPDVTDNIVTLEKLDQSMTDLSFTGKIDMPHMRWLKFRLKLLGHSQDRSIVYYPYALSATGELDVALAAYGTVAGLAITVNGAGGNR